MMYPEIELFGLSVGTYGVMSTLGAITAAAVGSRLIKQYDIDIYEFLLAMISAFIGLAVFAPLFYGMSNIRALIFGFSHLSEMSGGEFWRFMLRCFGGIVFYGGFIGGCIGILIYTGVVKDVRVHREHLLDVYAVLTPLFHAFGRVGCFFGGCCYGIESEFGFTTHTNTLNPSINHVNRLPIQLIESGCNIIIFLILLTLFRKRIMERRLIYIYMIIFPIVRFIDEFYRGDTYRGIFFGLSFSQWISIALLIFAAIMLPIKSRRMKTTLYE